MAGVNDTSDAGYWLHTKGQDLRIIDVVALGPFMVWYGATSREMPEWARLLLVVSGVATIAYNGANYLARREYDAAIAAEESAYL